MDTTNTTHHHASLNSVMLPDDAAAMLMRDDNDIAALNSFAVSTLQQGHHKQAVDLFARAFQLLKEEQQQQHQQQQHPPVSSSSTSSTCSSPRTPACCSLITGIDATPNDADQPTLSHRWSESAFSVYKRAFLVSEACSVQVKRAVVLYNAGLACHLQSARGTAVACQESSKFSFLSLNLYQSAYESVMQHVVLHHRNNNSGHRGGGVSDDDAMRSIVVLVAALCNNIAHINCEFFHVKEARAWRDALCDILDAQSKNRQMDTTDYDFFHRGLFYSYTDDFNCAPAA